MKRFFSTFILIIILILICFTSSGCRFDVMTFPEPADEEESAIKYDQSRENNENSHFKATKKRGFSLP